MLFLSIATLSLLSLVTASPLASTNSANSLNMPGSSPTQRFSCSSDQDCGLKPTQAGNCCGSFVMCASADFVPSFPRCASGTMSICANLDMKSRVDAEAKCGCSQGFCDPV